MSDRRQPLGRAAYDGVTRFLSLVMIVLGVLLIARGAVLGIVVGVAMIGAGCGRLWVVARLRRGG